MFKEIVELFDKLVSPSSIIESSILHSSAIPVDIMNVLFITDGLDNDPQKYCKVIEGDDIVMVLYNGFYQKKGRPVIDEVILRNGKPTLFLIMDSDIIMQDANEQTVATFLIIALNCSTFYKAKFSSFCYHGDSSIIQQTIDKSKLVLFIAFNITTFRRSETLDSIMLTNIHKIKGYEHFTKEELDAYVNTIQKFGVSFLLDNSGIAGGDEENSDGK